MPVVSVNMAQPYARESRVYILPSEDILQTNIVNISKKKYVIIKMVQFVLTFISLTFFILGVAATESTVKDMLTCVSFGAFTIYPFIFITLSFRLNNNKGLITCNLLVTTFLIIIGSLIISSWWNIQYVLEEIEKDKPELFFKGQFSANMRLCTALVTFINGILYMSESILLISEVKENNQLFFASILILFTIVMFVQE